MCGLLKSYLLSLLDRDVMPLTSDSPAIVDNADHAFHEGSSHEDDRAEDKTSGGVHVFKE